MVKQKKKFKRENILVTCALPYVNNVPHVGHIAGSHLPGDIFSRFCKLRGHNCIYIGGSDEHGTPSVVAAQELGVTPQKLCDVLYEEHRRIYNWFRINYDNFSRTSRPIHHKTTIEFFKKIYEKGLVEEQEVILPFCEKCGRTLPDRYITGRCPKCGYEHARGDQCEKCTSLLEPKELVEPRCAVCKEKPVFRGFRHLFLKLDKLEPKIERWITSQKHWRPTVRTLALGWIKEGLMPRCITRDLDWGVKVPVKGFENKVLYVWFDAPIGYISSTKEWAQREKKSWELFWKNKHSKIIHFIGKDNIPFHTVWWGGMLIANGAFNMPYNVAGLQYLNYEGDKISKSRAWGVFCEHLPDAGLDPDVWRFYLTLMIPENKDTEWKWEEFRDKVNSELVGNIGNFVNRTVTFIHRYFNGRMPAAKFGAKEKALLKIDYDGIWKLVWETRLRDALKEILECSARGNKYFQESEPWKTVGEKRCAAVINACANLCKDLGILIWPYLPGASEIICDAFGIKPRWQELGKPLKAGTHVKLIKPLFPKIDEKELERLKSIVTQITPLENYFGGGKLVSIDEFKKMELKVGTIKKVEDITGSDNLYKMDVDTGGPRTIVAGIKRWYKKDELVGKQIIVVTNLEPAVIRGVKSDGMLLAAEDDKNVILIQPDKKANNGTRIH